MEAENIINIFILEYKKTEQELNHKKQELNIEKQKYVKLSSKLQKAKNEINILNTKTNELKTQIEEDEEKYIEKKSNRLAAKMMIFGTVISLSLATITSLIQGSISNNTLADIPTSIMYLGFGIATTSVIYIISRQKHINKQKKQYKETPLCLERQKQLDKITKEKEEKLNEWNKSKEYEEYNKTVTTIQTLEFTIKKLESKIEELKTLVFNEIIINNNINNEEETLVLHEELEDKQKSLTKIKRRI